MTVVVVVLTVVVAMLTLLVAGLLRSHATILRRLHELGAGVEQDVRAAAADSPRAAAGPGSAPPTRVTEGRVAADISGVGPTGEAMAIRVGGIDHDTVLAFLSSGCTTCHVFWEELRDPQLPAGTRLVVVTKGEDAESPVAVADLAPAGRDGRDEQRRLDGVRGARQPVRHPRRRRRPGESAARAPGRAGTQVRGMLLQGAGDLDARRVHRRRPLTRSARREPTPRCSPPASALVTPACTAARRHARGPQDADDRLARVSRWRPWPVVRSNWSP